MHDPSPIDIVYLWVDGNDPAWRRKRRAAVERLGAVQRAAMGLYGNVEGRFRDNDELRYSLRALEQFYPDHGHVYLVTDNQRPAWLQPSDRLTVVDHRSLMPAAALPTFDSSHIESYIHRIPGLSERFFYLNDDVFFGAPVRLDDWFWDGGVYAAWSDDAEVADGPLRRDADSLHNASRLSRQWLSQPPAPQPGVPADLPQPVHDAQTPRTFAHSPRPMLRSVLFHLERRVPELFERVRSTVFRTWDKPTLVADFVIRWSLAHGLARIREHSHLHVSTGDADAGRQLEQLAARVGAVDCFCLNDTTDDARPDDPRLAQVREVLQGLFPRPSRFETLQAPAPRHGGRLETCPVTSPG